MAREENKWFVLLMLMVAFVLALVGFATPNWYKVSFNTTATPAITAGFFDACVSSTCRRYIEYFPITKYSDDLIGCIVFCVFGIFALGLGLVFCFCSICRCGEECDCGVCRTDRKRFLYVAWLSLTGGVLLIATVIWFYISQIRNRDGAFNLTGIGSIVADYSLALVAAAGGVAVVLAVLVFLMRLRMYDEYDDEGYYEERRVRKRAPPPVHYAQEMVRPRVAEPPPYVVPGPSPYRYAYKPEPQYIEYGTSKKYLTYPDKKRYTHETQY